jgi:hypothetical protein
MHIIVLSIVSNRPSLAAMILENVFWYTLFLPCSPLFPARAKLSPLYAILADVQNTIPQQL